MPDYNEKICIIGAGPAGLSAGMYLQQKGYTNYTILERNDHVGGKCHSPVYNGKRYEMGAIMGVPSYYAVKDVEDFCGFTHDGPKLKAIYRTLDGTQENPMDDSGDPAKEESLAAMRKQFRKFLLLLETKYKGYDVNGHRGVAQGRYEGCAATPKREPVSGENENLKDLALPFQEFLELNGIPEVKRLWIAPFTSFGYGYFDEIPAAYVLKYLDFQTNSNFMRVNLWTWKDGTQSIWERLNDKLDRPARLNSIIRRVERGDNKVYVTVNDVVEEYDKIIVTAPLQFMPDYFDADDQEKELFSKIDYERYSILGFVPKQEECPDESCFILRNMEPDRVGHLMLYYRRWMEDPDQAIVTYTLRNHRNQRQVPYGECKDTVVQELETMKAPVDKIVNEKDWYYFPHIYTEDYQNGWYDKVEAMQGNKNTYYAGEIMSFGNMDETAEYSRELVERFF